MLQKAALALIAVFVADASASQIKLATEAKVKYYVPNGFMHAQTYKSDGEDVGPIVHGDSIEEDPIIQVIEEGEVETMKKKSDD